MSIASEITRLQNDSAAIASAISAKGVTVPSGSGYDDYATLIGQISTGGGGSNVPYTSKVEYLQTDGSQYFTIDYLSWGEANACFYIDFQQTTNTNQARLITPMTSSTATDQLYINGSGAIAYSFNNAWLNTGVIAGTTRHTVKLDYKNKVITVDGTDYTISGSSSRSTSNLGIVAKYGTNATFVGKIYALKMWKNDTLLHDYIPVRVLTVGYMYDQVTGELVGNHGTGSWTLGSDVSES